MMRSPYEELEYLANYLPDEGESVVVTRRSGDLVVERPSSLEERGHQREQSFESDRDAASIVAYEIENREFDGRLIQASARLRQLSAAPIWVTMIAAFWLGVTLHFFVPAQVAWTVTAGVIMAAIPVAISWIRVRRSRLFRSEIRAMLAWQLRRCRLERFTTMSKMCGRPELRHLLAEMTRWIEA